MDKEQKIALEKAWRISHSIIGEIRDLAEMNTMLAYGVIRQAETMIDMIFVNNLRKEEEKIIKEKKK